MHRLYALILYSADVLNLYFLIHPPSRNAALRGLFGGSKTPKPVKTGTTIAGVVFKASASD